MRRPPITAILTAGACALGLASPAAAQTSAPQSAAPQSTAPSSANAAGLRYLSWPGRAYRPAPAAPAAEVAAAADAAPIVAAATPGRPPIIPHGGHPAPAPSTAPRQGLTPASAWIGSQAPAYAPQPAPAVEAPAALPAPVVAPAPAPWSRTRAIAPAPRPAPAPNPVTPAGYFAETAEAAPPSPPAVISRPAPSRPLPAAPAPRAEPTHVPAPAAPAPVVEARLPETPSPEAAADPMAPRRDAPIFRLQRPAPSEPAQQQAQAAVSTAPASPAIAPAADGGARYYSVHRQAGRQPDAPPLPAPVYLDALPVELTSTPASTDLAEPPAAPNLIRNANGRLQALPANEDPILP